jgi:hypothetical protein
MLGQKMKNNNNKINKNNFWAVYNKKGVVVSISKNKRTAIEEALTKSNIRWNVQTFKKDCKYLKDDGYEILKSKIVPYNKEKVLKNNNIKITIRDLLALPFAFLSFIFVILTIEIGGEYTARRIIEIFNGYKNEKII